MEKIFLKNIPANSLKPYDKNYLRHDKNVEFIKNSLQTFGYIKTSIIVDENNILLCGHGTLQAIKLLKWENIPEVIQVKGLTDKQKSAYRIADNSSGKNAEIIIDNLSSELKIIDEEFNMEDFGLDLEDIATRIDESGSPNNYSRKVESPTYTPTGEKPLISELLDQTKTNQLIDKINKSKLPEEEKEFLIKAASRHIIFDYGKIAEYYSHAEKELQELMEDSVLVIIDFNKAIENGFVKLSEEIQEQYKQDYGNEQK